jgi:hypothetical protein
MAQNPVQGYLFQSVDEEDPRNGTICKIVRRAAVSDVEAREMGPAFTVEFGDGFKRTAFGEELSPWFPV